MRAITQTQLNILQSEAQAEFEANQQKIAELQTQQAKLRQSLNRFNFHKALIGGRAVPTYAPWLPFSDQA